ncbi:hypothetical protein cypCar_00019190, partial [Cyprinus carpio]
LKVSLFNYSLTFIITLFVYNTDYVMMSGMVPSAGALGLETLDEDENARILSSLKKECSTSIDCPRLNQEQEPSTPTSSQQRNLKDMDAGQRLLPEPIHMHQLTLGKTPVASARAKKPESRPLPRAPAPSRTRNAAKSPSPLTQRKAQNQPPKKTQNLSQTQTVKGTWLHHAEEARTKQKWSFGEVSDPLTEEKLKLVEKEMKEQETLIQGYHQGPMNMKSIQRTIGGRSIVDQSFNIAELTSQVQATQKKEERLQDEILWLKQEKQAVHVDTEMVRKERECTSGSASVLEVLSSRIFSLQYEQQISDLEQRLAEKNQNNQVISSEESQTQGLNAEMEEVKKLSKLLEELKQAKEAHSPVLRHFTSLEQKIQSMELRYNQREKQLQQ